MRQSSRKPAVVDTHAHLDEMPDVSAAIERAREAGVIAIVAVGTDYDSNNRVLQIAAAHPGFVFPALGMHPQNLGRSDEINLRFIEEHAESAVAIGEIGLDYHKKSLGRTGKDRQKQVFRDVLEIARRAAKPVSIHSRYSWQDCLTIAEESGINRAVFHWYTGPMKVLRGFLSAGHFASATLAAEYHHEHRRAIRETPLEQLMLETDAPVVYRWGTEHAHSAEPADAASRVLDAVAALKETSARTVAEASTRNALGFFNLSVAGV